MLHPISHMNIISYEAYPEHEKIYILSREKLSKFRIITRKSI